MSSTPYRPPENHGLAILHLSEQLIVVNKPSGLLSVPGRGAGKEDCLSRRVQAEFADALIVHRLDMGTSGIVVLARGADALRALSVMFQERRVRKRYQALVDGCWTAAAEGEIDLPMTVDGPKQKVDHAAGRPSLTRYRVIDIDTARGVAHRARSRHGAFAPVAGAPGGDGASHPRRRLLRHAGLLREGGAADVARQPDRILRTRHGPAALH
jgi:tRNA pseudouridine32 synthase/23S rRNA pseudouridine746 synthase